MSDQRFIIEMGMGNDLHGADYTKAACRAVDDAMRHSTLALFGVDGVSAADLRVQVTIGVQDPDQLDLEAVRAVLPTGNVTVTAVKGGLNVANPDRDDVAVIAQAAVEAFLPKQV